MYFTHPLIYDLSKPDRGSTSEYIPRSQLRHISKKSYIILVMLQYHAARRVKY